MNKSYYAYDLEDSTDFVIENDSLFYIQQGDIISQTLATQMNLDARPELYNWISLPAQGSLVGSLSIDESDVQEGDIAVAYGRVTYWVLRFAFRNVDDALEQVSVTFDDIYTPLGDPLTVNITSFGQNTDVNLSADGNSYYTIGLPSNTVPYETLSFTANVTSATGAPSPVADMKVYFEDAITIDRMYGMMYHKVLPVNSYTLGIDIDYPEGADSAVVISESAPRLNIGVWNRLGFPVELHGKLTAYNDNGDSRSLTFNASDNLVFAAANSMGDSVHSVCTLQDSVGWLLNVFPSRLELTDAFFYIGVSQTDYGFAYNGATASGVFDGRIPFLFSLTGKPMYLPEPVENHVSRKNQEYITDYARSGEVSFTVQNVYPAGAYTEIYLSTSGDEDTLYHAPILLFPRPGEESYVPSGETATLTYTLTQDDIAFFASDTLYVGMRFTFDETAGDVYVAPNDYLKLVGQTTIKLYIDK